MDILLASTLIADASRRGSQGALNELKSQLKLPKKRLTGTIARVLWAQRSYRMQRWSLEMLESHIESLGFDPKSSQGQRIDPFVPWLAREVNARWLAWEERKKRGGNPKVSEAIVKSGMLGDRVGMREAGRALGLSADDYVENYINVVEAAFSYDQRTPLWGVTEDELVQLFQDRSSWPLRRSRGYAHAEVMEIWHWFSWPGEDKPDIMTLTFEQALRVAKSWSTGIEDELADRQLVSPGETVYAWPDGWTVQLVPYEVVRSEGMSMQNCLQHGYYGDAIKSGKKKIYSLREPPVTAAWMGKTSGWSRPVVTMAVEQGSERHHIVEIKGRQNHPPAPKYHERVLEFLAMASKRGEILGALDGGCTELDRMISTREDGEPCLPAHIHGEILLGWIEESERRKADWTTRPRWMVKLEELSCPQVEGGVFVVPELRDRLLQSPIGMLWLARIEGPSGQLRRGILVEGGDFTVLDYAIVEGPNDDTRSRIIDSGDARLIRRYAIEVDKVYRPDTAQAIVLSSRGVRERQALRYVSMLRGAEDDAALLQTALRCEDVQAVKDAVYIMGPRVPAALFDKLLRLPDALLETIEMWARHWPASDEEIWALMSSPTVEQVVTGSDVGGTGSFEHLEIYDTEPSAPAKWIRDLRRYGHRSNGGPDGRWHSWFEAMVPRVCRHLIDDGRAEALWSLWGEQVIPDELLPSAVAVMATGLPFRHLRLLWRNLMRCRLTPQLDARLVEEPNLVVPLISEMVDANKSRRTAGQPDRHGFCETWERLVEIVMEHGGPAEAQALIDPGSGAIDAIAFCRTEPSGRWADTMTMPQLVDRAAALACSSPHGAVDFAKRFGPSDVSRNMAITDPVTSMLYAKLVDGRGRDDTRRGAMVNPVYAVRYAHNVDGWVHPEIQELIDEVGGAAEVDALDTLCRDSLPVGGLEGWVEVTGMFHDDPDEVIELLDGLAQENGGEPVITDDVQIERFMMVADELAAWLRRLMGLDDDEYEIVRNSMALWLKRPLRDLRDGGTVEGPPFLALLPGDRLFVHQNPDRHGVDIERTSPLNAVLGGGVWLPRDKIPSSESFVSFDFDLNLENMFSPDRDSCRGWSGRYSRRYESGSWCLYGVSEILRYTDILKRSVAEFERDDPLVEALMDGPLRLRMAPRHRPFSGEP